MSAVYTAGQEITIVDAAVYQATCWIKMLQANHPTNSHHLPAGLWDQHGDDIVVSYSVSRSIEMKTLHGKRHMRARKFMLIGRDKKRVKKFNRMAEQLSVMTKPIVPNTIRAINEMIDTVNKVVDALSQIRITR